jgi:hypothetical protein
MRARLPILVLCGLIAVSCGHGTGPTAPSSGLPGTGSSPISNGASITGTVVTSVRASAFTAEATGLTVTVTGSTISATVNGSGVFTLQGVPSGNVELRFNGPGVDARLMIANVGDRDDIRITIRVNGNQAEIEDNRREKPDHGVEIEGSLTAVNPGARTLSVAGTMVNVPAGTPIRQGDRTVDFSALHLGDRVEVKGTATGSTVTATEVRLQNPQGNPGPNPEVELKGALTGLAGACPSLTFMVSGSSVQTNGATRFDDAACTTFRNGDVVEVKGTRQANGVVLASKVEKDDDDDDDNEVEVEGTLSGLGGACPSITFTVSGRSVATNGGTRFDDTTCAALKSGDRVEVKGVRQANNVVLANRVEKKK